MNNAMPTFDCVPNDQMRFGIVTSDVAMSSPNIDLGCWLLHRPEVGSDDFTKINNLLEYYACSNLGANADRPIGHSNECRLKWSTVVRGRGASTHSVFNPDQSLWRFTIVSPKPDAREVSGQVISRALRILEPGLKVDAWSILDKDGVIKFGGHAERCVAELQLNRMQPAVSVTEADFSAVTSIVQSIINVHRNRDFDFVETALARFETFDGAREDVLKSIGYFSIQELLVAPGQRKVSKRFRENLASRFDNQGYDEKYFKRLYDLRSTM